MGRKSKSLAVSHHFQWHFTHIGKHVVQAGSVKATCTPHSVCCSEPLQGAERRKGGPEPQSSLRLLSSSTIFTGLWYDCQRKEAHLERNPYKYVPSRDSVILEMRNWEIYGEFTGPQMRLRKDRYVYLNTCIEIHTVNVHPSHWSSYSDPVPPYIYSWSPSLPRIKKVE